MGSFATSSGCTCLGSLGKVTANRVGLASQVLVALTFMSGETANVSNAEPSLIRHLI